MSAGCSHVKQLQLASDKSFLNPRTWACVQCGFTDSVWACLLCSNVSCGRSNSRHALRHFELTKHPIAIEVNRRHVHCYLCDDYVLTDNLSGDISLIQSLLEQVASQQYNESCSRSGRVIKPAQALFTRSKSRVEEATDNAADKRYTALCHWKFSQLARAFNTWRHFVGVSKAQARDVNLTKHPVGVSKPQARDLTKHPGKRRRKPLTPGMTGFRNLGNTCYMNAVLQSLGHLFLFRDFFRQLLPKTPQSPLNDVPASQMSQHIYSRQTTMECFTHISAQPTSLTTGGCGRVTRQRGGGLNGGEGGNMATRSSRTKANVTGENLCLSVEMHGLMRVIWSGKWAVVTPHAVLNAVWELTPCFHGYAQHDAQEFLCELLLVLQRELEAWPAIPLYPSPSMSPLYPNQLLPSLFQGQLLSKVTYEGCGHCSTVSEPFWDLSLHFPDNVQSDRMSKASPVVTLEELLSHFTLSEDLDGQDYSCETCGHDRLQRAHKQIMIAEQPEVLRIHLKRFRWSGRTQHKINTFVHFPFQLDLRPFYTSLADMVGGVAPNRDDTGGVASTSSDGGVAPSGDDAGGVAPSEDEENDGGVALMYQLSSVIVHHGSGFQSGHYTAYCWNSEAESWVHCNDARLSRTIAKEVLDCQAYILFYTRLKGKCNFEEEILTRDQIEPSLDGPNTKKIKT